MSLESRKKVCRLFSIAGIGDGEGSTDKYRERFGDGFGHPFISLVSRDLLADLASLGHRMP
jgi:hypothetical protein